MSKVSQKDISFSLEVQMVQAKMNLYLNLLVFSLNCVENIKDENVINNE